MKTFCIFAGTERIQKKKIIHLNTGALVKAEDQSMFLAAV